MFEDIIRVCARTVLFATPILQPTALSRAWCLYEVMTTMSNGKELLVALSLSDRGRLKDLLSTDFDSIVTMFTSIKSEKAVATLEEDRTKIFGWIKRDLGTNGFKELDHIVGDGMRAWMAETGAKFAEDSDDTDLSLSVGRLLHNLARFTEAEVLYARALEIQEARHGPDHPDVAATLDNMAESLRKQWKTIDAIPLSRRALAIKESFYGADHSEVAKSLLVLANSLFDHGKYSEAKPLYSRALEIKEKVYDPDHLEMANLLMHMANFAIVTKCNHSEAEPYSRRALQMSSPRMGQTTQKSRTRWQTWPFWSPTRGSLRKLKR